MILLELVLRLNFKNFLLPFLFVFAIGCGVKSAPKPPTGTSLPSYVDKFLENEDQKDLGKKKESSLKR